MKFIILFSFFFSFNWSFIAYAKTSQLKPLTKAAGVTKKKPIKKLEKSLSFNDRLVNGKHQIPGEGIITVEDEKPTFNLLSIRSDFKDRREKEQQRD